MMYSDNMALAIKVNGQVQKERKDTVYLPFGCEYSLYLKNMNTVRAIAKIEIDGTPVSEGGFVIGANDYIDIERFVKSNYEGNRFKFIERSDSVEQSRGIGAEDGLIRVSFRFEDVQPILSPLPYVRDNSRWNPRSTGDFYPPHLDITCQTNSSRLTKGKNNGEVRVRSMLRSSGPSESSLSTNMSSIPTAMYSAEVNDAGITVPGSISDQQFRTVKSFPLQQQEFVMVMKILGRNGDEPVVRPVSSREKPVCVTCRKVNRRDAKFCTECGTSLIVV